MLPVESPFKTYTGIDGKALDQGYVYFGQPNQNPITSPVTVYWDAAGTQPATQPLRTVNGYIMRAGTPANVFYDGEYSELVKDKKGRQVFYSRTSADFSIASYLLAFIASLALSAGSSLIGFIQDGVGAVLRTVQAVLRERPSTPEDFGAVGDGVTDDYAAFQKWAEHLRTKNKEWSIPGKDYFLDGAAPIILKTSGVCYGRILILKSNQNCRFEIARDVAGSVLDTAGWNPLTRGITAANALNAAGKNLFLISTEVLIERIGSGGASYFKQEVIRCPLPNGSFSTALVCTYNSLANLVVTAYTPSEPITITGLRVLRTGPSGGVELNRGSIVVTRDNVTLNSPSVINAGQAEPIPVAIEVSYCADVTINAPYVRGFNFNGIGYGVIAGTTIGLTINESNMQDCRHAFTAVFDVDTVLNGGSYSRMIDSHWTDRFTANDVKVAGPVGGSVFEFAGADVTLNNVVGTGGRSLFGIRTDTPSMGGSVIIRSPKMISRGESSYFIFGFSSPNGTGPITPGFFTNKPKLPDSVILEDVQVDTDSPLIYGAYLGVLEAPHTNWGTIAIRGNCEFSSLTLGVLAFKDSTYQEDRNGMLVIDGPMDFGAGGSAIYVIANDATPLRGFDVRISKTARADLRFSPYGVNTLYATSATIGTVENDDSTEPFASQLYTFQSCVMSGGVIRSTFSNIAIMGSTFTGVYSQVPGPLILTLVGNIRAAAIGALPADIRANVVSPFA